MKYRLVLLNSVKRILYRIERFPLAMMVVSVFLALGIVQSTFQLGHMLYRSYTWKQESKAALVRVQQLKEDIQILSAAKRAAYDPIYLEQLARCQGYVRQNELLMVDATAAGQALGYNCQISRLP